MSDNSLYHYVVVIRNTNRRFINTLGFLLTAGSAVMFIREMLIVREVVLPLALGVAFIAGLLIWNFYSSRYHDKETYYSKALLIAGLVWTKMPFFEWLFFAFVALALLEYQAKHPLEIGFSPGQVVFNTLFKRRFQWKDLSNVVLRDGLLTIDFNNNKLFQKEIDEGESEASEEEFNAWCNRQLSGTENAPVADME